MLDIKEIEWAISELEKSESSFSAYQKLASLYTIRDKLTGSAADAPAGYALASLVPAPQAQSTVLPACGDSEFLQTLSGKDAIAVCMVMDNLMESLRVINPRVYDSVLRKLRKIGSPV